jgi:hypothetical protein
MCVCLCAMRTLYVRLCVSTCATCIFIASDAAMSSTRLVLCHSGFMPDHYRKVFLRRTTHYCSTSVHHYGTGSGSLRAPAVPALRLARWTQVGLLLQYVCKHQLELPTDCSVSLFRPQVHEPFICNPCHHHSQVGNPFGFRHCLKKER